MDSLAIQLTNKQYFIEFSKVLKPISFTDNSKYITYIKFINNIGQTVLCIESSELEFYTAIQTLDYLNTEIMMIMGDNIYFESSSGNNFCISIEIKEEAIRLFEEYIDSINGHDEFNIPMYNMMITEYNQTNGSKIRLFTELSINDLENIICGMYQVIEDVPYLDKLQFDFIENMKESM